MLFTREFPIKRFSFSVIIALEFLNIYLNDVNAWFVMISMIFLNIYSTDANAVLNVIGYMIIAYFSQHSFYSESFRNLR